MNEWQELREWIDKKFKHIFDRFDELEKKLDEVSGKIEMSEEDD